MTEHPNATANWMGEETSWDTPAWRWKSTETFPTLNVSGCPHHNIPWTASAGRADTLPPCLCLPWPASCPLAGGGCRQPALQETGDTMLFSAEWSHLFPVQSQERHREVVTNTIKKKATTTEQPTAKRSLDGGCYWHSHYHSAFKTGKPPSLSLITFTSAKMYLEDIPPPRGDCHSALEPLDWFWSKPTLSYLII